MPIELSRLLTMTSFASGLGDVQEGYEALGGGFQGGGSRAWSSYPTTVHIKENPLK